MQGVELVVIMLAVSAALRMVARRLGVPHPVLLVLAGLALVFVPGLPRVEFEPDTLFLVFVPPLLYWAALTSSLRDFRANLWPILRFGTLLVLLTIAAVAVVAHALTPEFTWAAAFTLGAIVSPPDPVAAIAVMRSIGAQRDLSTVLEGEGLVNDATALVAYRVAIGAALTGSFSPGQAAVGFLLAGTGGVAVGLAVGWLISQVRRRVRGFPIVENTISLLTPFFAYLPAEWLGLSGVLSVVAVGLYLGRVGPRIVPAATRIQAESMWVMVQFILESLVFILVGLELPYILRTLRTHLLGTLVLYGALITLTVIGVRIVYTFRRRLADPPVSPRQAGRGDARLAAGRVSELGGDAGWRFPGPLARAASDRGCGSTVSSARDDHLHHLQRDSGDAGAAGAHLGAADPLVGADRGRRRRHRRGARTTGRGRSRSPASRHGVQARRRGSRDGEIPGSDLSPPCPAMVGPGRRATWSG